MRKREADLAAQDMQLAAERSRLDIELQRARAAEERAQQAANSSKEQAEKAAADCAWARQQQAELAGTVQCWQNVHGYQAPDAACC